MRTKLLFSRRVAVGGILLIAIVSGVVGVRPLLVGLAYGLIDEDHPVAAGGLPVWIVLTANHRRVPETYEFVAALARSTKAAKVFVLSRPLTRVEELGVVPPAFLLARQELEKRGLPTDSIEVHPVSAIDLWDEGRIIGELLTRTDAQLFFCVAEFGTRGAQVVLSRLLPCKVGERVSIKGIPDTRYGPRNWWKSRSGWKALFWAYSDLAYTSLFGEPKKLAPLSVDEYERWARQRIFDSTGIAPSF